MELAEKHIVVVGAGIAGLETALGLSRLGYRATLLEQASMIGGKLNHWCHLFPDFTNPQDITGHLARKLEMQDIKVYCNTQVTGIKQDNGRFELMAGPDTRLYADAVVLSSGFELFDARLKEEYGYGLFEHVITSADFESLMQRREPFLNAEGHYPTRVAIVHCVGSRDTKVRNTYCSKVCCITGIKQAIEINRMAPECEVYCFYMDLRLYGSKFDALYLTAQKEHKIQFIRGRLSEVAEKDNKTLQIKAEDTLSGRPLRMNVDKVILLVGMEPSASALALTDDNRLELDENGFYRTPDMHLRRNHSNHPGIFFAGTAVCPMSVNETLENARSAVMEVNEYIQNQAP